MNEEKEISFFKKILISIKDFDKYAELATLSINKTMLYIMKLIAIYTIVVATISVYQISIRVNDLYNYIKNDIGEISYKDGILEISNNEPIILENEKNIINKVIIDTGSIEKEKEDEYLQQIEKEASGIILFSDKIIIKGSMSSAIVSYSYNELSQNYNIEAFDKSYILSQFSSTNIATLCVMIFIVSFFYLFIMYFVSMLLNIVLLSGLGYFTAILLRLRLRYSAICNIATYSLTLPIILNMVYIIINTFTGFYIKYFDVMYIAIAYIYIITAILLIKADVIKKGQELAKIVEEQEKVRQELERQKEEEERQKEEQRREEEKEKKKQKEKEKENKKEQGKIGSSPQGDNV